MWFTSPQPDTPRIRRLKNDQRVLERLRGESSVLDFKASGGIPPTTYHVVFRGAGLVRRDNKISLIHEHHVEIKLIGSYPRTMPELRWLTPIFHPNIAESGLVCIGEFGSHWAPSVGLDDLLSMLWDMARFLNHDPLSPYNRDAAKWVASQTVFTFPLDRRPLRDRPQPAPPVDLAASEPVSSLTKRATADPDSPASSPSRDNSEILFLD